MADGTIAVDHFIELDRQSIRRQLGAGMLLLLVGTAGIAGAYAKLFVVSAPNFEMITKGVGLVIDLIGLFPFKNCWPRWERIKTLRAIKTNPAALDPESVHELIGKLYAKFLEV